MSHDVKGRARRGFLIGAATAAAMAVTAGTAGPASAKTAREIDAGVESALAELLETRPVMQGLYDRAVGVLVIPEIIKAGFILGGSYGEGALLIDDRTDSYWSYGAASIGFQAGAQRTRQVLFFMTNSALDSFLASDGFELGVDAEVTVIDAGGELSVDTTKNAQPVIAVVYSRQGLLGGASLEGGKYSPINP